MVNKEKLANYLARIFIEKLKKQNNRLDYSHVTLS